MTVIQAFTCIVYGFNARKRRYTAQVMEMKIDVTKNQNGVRMALNVTRFRLVNLLQNITRFFSIAFIGALY